MKTPSRRRFRGARALVGAVLIVAPLAGCAGAKQETAMHEAAGPEEPARNDALRFTITKGEVRNYFMRDGDVAAHLVVSSGTAPRIIAAFPEGNTGLGVWFEDVGKAVTVEAVDTLLPVHENGMRGVTTVLAANTSSLPLKTGILSSVRLLRNYTAGIEPLDVFKPEIEVEGGTLRLRRTTLGGDHHYELRLRPVGKTRIAFDEGHLTLSAPDGGSITVHVTALHDEPRLTPIPLEGILRTGTHRRRDLYALAFLSYEEKLLAGSWRYLTYFGRHTLMSVRLLMPALTPAVIEGGLRSVLERLDERGAVAHEEDIGEFAALRRRQEGRKPTHDPIYSYKMIDDDFMLAPVIAEYLLNTEVGRERGEAFLAEETSAGDTHAAALRRNLDYVLERATPYAEHPSTENLIALLEGYNVGDWRDSEEGLGWGRYPYNVSGILVPEALHSAARLYESPLLGEDEDAAARARELADAWSDAAEMFHVAVPIRQARRRIKAYAEREGFDPADALASLDDAGGAVTFPALALDGDGRPIPVMHSDDGFLLLFGSPDDETLQSAAERILRPFPAGLRTPVGVVVANPALSGDDELEGLFDREAYHGAVIWSWQQAILAAGLERQLQRSDIADRTRQMLVAAQQALWDVIVATEDAQTSELWSWAVDDGEFVVHHFGQGTDLESNAVQLWSTVYLAVQPPAR